MLVLLPPSETKAHGGSLPPIETAGPAFAGLAVSRAAALTALDALVTAGQDTSTPARARAAAANAAVRTGPTMPAIERYTGVLYDALDAASLGAQARSWLDDHVVIASALFGFVRAAEPIPEYKVSHTTKLPGVRLTQLWADAGAALPTGLVVDLRSKAYAKLAPVAGALRVEVVGEHGAALNHWNKHGKGMLVRAFAEHAVDAGDVEALLAAAREHGIALSRDGDGLRLVVTDPRSSA